LKAFHLKEKLACESKTLFAFSIIKIRTALNKLKMTANGNTTVSERGNMPSRKRQPNILSKSEKWDRLDMARDTEG
jgi:hypothetical protein